MRDILTALLAAVAGVLLITIAALLVAAWLDRRHAEWLRAPKPARPASTPTGKNARQRNAPASLARKIAPRRASTLARDARPGA